MEAIKKKVQKAFRKTEMWLMRRPEDKSGKCFYYNFGFTARPNSNNRSYDVIAMKVVLREMGRQYAEKLSVLKTALDNYTVALSGPAEINIKLAHIEVENSYKKEHNAFLDLCDAVDAARAKDYHEISANLKQYLPRRSSPSRAKLKEAAVAK
jgi:hypothetical protein